MNVLDMLFPVRSRSLERFAAARMGRRDLVRCRRSGLEAAERLEERLPLAVTPSGVLPTTPNLFFIDSGTGLDAEYAAYQITNDLTDPGPAVDVWVRATNFGVGTIGLAPHEDGIYRVGLLDNGETGSAFLYFAATGPQGVPQSYDFEVWNGNPLMGGSLLFTETYAFASVIETLEAEPNKIDSVILSPADPGVGDILQMTVQGRLGNGADRVLFAPATTSDWLADTFELRGAAITISGIPVTPDQLYYDSLPSPQQNQQPFTAVYSFLITGSAATATQTSPSQYTQDNDQNWKHHRPSSTPFPVIPPLIYELALSKDDGLTTYTPGGSTTYTIELTNTGKADVEDVVISDVLPPQLDATTTTWYATYTDASGTLPTTPTTGDIAGTVSLEKVTGSVTITILADILSSALGDLTNTVTATAPGDEPLSASDTNTRVPDIDLALDKETVGVVVAGEAVSYTITIENLGSSDVFGAAVTDPFSGELSGVSWTALFTDGSGNPSGMGDIDELIDLAAGGSVVYTVTGLLSASAVGLLENTATVTSPEDTASDTVLDEILGRSQIVIEKTGDITYKAGGFVDFTVVVTNQGPSFASSVNVFDALPINVVNWSWTVSYSAGSGPADGSPNAATDSVLPIDKNVDLAAAGTATFGITALTVEGQEEDVINDAFASLGEQIVSARWISAYDGPINPTVDVGGLIVGSDDGCNGPPFVRILDPDSGDLLAEFLAFEPAFNGSVRVASGDLTGDGIAEVVVANGRNRIGEIRVFTPAGVELTEFRTIPFNNGYSGGVEVAVADVDGDGFNDLIAGKSVGQGRVKVFRVDPTLPDPVIDEKYAGFYAYKYPYNGGTMVAGADIGTYVNGVKVSDALDGKAEIVSTPNAGKRARVKYVDVTGKPTVVRTDFAFEKEFRGGGTLSVGEYDDDGVQDIFVGMGVGGRSEVEVFSGATGAKLARITAFAEFAKPQARVFAAALDSDGDGVIDEVYGVQGAAGGGGTNGVLGFDRITDSTGILPNSTFLEPPLRIAPIILQLPG